MQVECIIFVKLLLATVIWRLKLRSLSAIGTEGGSDPLIPIIIMVVQPLAVTVMCFWSSMPRCSACCCWCMLSSEVMDQLWPKTLGTREFHHSKACMQVTPVCCALNRRCGCIFVLILQFDVFDTVPWVSPPQSAAAEQHLPAPVLVLPVMFIKFWYDSLC